MSRVWFATGVAASVAALLSFQQACGGDEPESAAREVGGPPAKPSAPATTSTATKTFAVRTVFLGDRPRGGGGLNGDAWRKFGYNIDGKVTTRGAKDGCKPVQGAPDSVKDDGDEGIDNSFGANILPLVTTANKEAADVMNRTIAEGKFTLLVHVKGLSDEATQTATGLSGVVLAGGNFGGTPTFTKADDWPVRPETLTNPSDPTSSSIRLDDAYIANGTFVARSDIKISLVFGGTDLTLDIKKAILTFDHKGAKADNGTFAGVVRSAQLIEELKKIRGNISQSLCGELFDNIANQIRQAADIMSDGTAGSPDQECDGISLGIGFSADEIGPPTRVGPAAVPGPDMCVTGGDAGADGS